MCLLRGSASPESRALRVRRPLGSAREPESTPHRRQETPRLRSGARVNAPLVSGDPSAPLGVTGFECDLVAFEACHLDQASASERVERSPELSSAVESGADFDARCRPRHRAHGTQGPTQQHTTFVLLWGPLDSTGRRFAPASSARGDMLGGAPHRPLPLDITGLVRRSTQETGLALDHPGGRLMTKVLERSPLRG
jgi:hypothetical protein